MADLGISFLGRSTSQIERIKQMNATLVDLQRQITTKKKYDNFSGFGAESSSLQRYRMSRDHLTVYTKNIDVAAPRVELMSNAMSQALELIRQITGGVQIQLRSGEIEIDALNTLAETHLDFMNDLTNVEIDGRYLFAGSDTTAIPLQNQPQLELNAESMVTDWLNGTITTAQFITGIDAMTLNDLGLNPALSASGPVSVRVSTTAEIDYTSKADSNGFQDIIQMMAFMSKLKIPDPATDTPTITDFHDVLNHLMSIAERGIGTVTQEAVSLADKNITLNNQRDRHQTDATMFSGLVDDIEGVDMNEAIAALQGLQTQLSSSYEVTRILSQLSLVNFL